MGQLHDRMEQDLILKGFSPATRRNYLFYARRLAVHYRCSPQELGETEIRKFLLHLIQVDQVAYATYRQVLAAIRFLYTVTLDRPWEVKRIPFPRHRSRKLPEVPNRDQLLRLFRAMRSPKYRALLMTCYAAGLRIGEACRLRPEDIDATRKVIRVRQGKGNKERVVPIGQYVSRILWSYIDKVRPEPAIPDCSNLFLTTDGHPISVNTIKLLFTRLARGSGVKRLHAHLCRHTFAINYLLNGGDIFSLKEILGHTTLEMVNHYVHFTNSQITAQHHKYSPMDKFYSR